MICKTLKLFVYPLTEDNKYDLLQTGYSKIGTCSYLRKEKYFGNFFGILKICIQCSTFSKKDDPHSGRIFELTDSERRGYINL